MLACTKLLKNESNFKSFFIAAFNENIWCWTFLMCTNPIWNESIICSTKSQFLWHEASTTGALLLSLDRMPVHCKVNPCPFPLHNLSGLPHNSVERERVIVLHLLLIINDDAEDNNDNHNHNNKLIIIVIISWSECTLLPLTQPLLFCSFYLDLKLSL